MMGGDGLARGDRERDPRRQLHREAPRAALPGALRGPGRARRARVHPRPAPAQGRVGHRGGGRREAPDRLRLPRADDELPGAGHADGRADRERVEGRARPLHRRDDRDPRARSARSRHGDARSRRQSAQARAAHGGGGDRRRVDASRTRARVAAYPTRRAGSREVLAAGRARRQRVRRPQPVLQLHSRRRARGRRAARRWRRCASSSSAPAWSASPPRGTCAQDGHEVTRRRPPPGRGARNVVRQRRADLGVVRGAVGQSGRAAEDPEVARPGGRAAAVPPARSTRGSGAGACSSCIECLPSRTRRNTIQCLNLALYSRDCLQELRAQTGIEYDHLERGILSFYTDAKEFEHGVAGRGADAPVRLRPRRARPSTNASRSSPRSPHAATSSPAASSPRATNPATRSASPQELARIAAERGVAFRWNMAVESLIAEGDAMTGVRCVNEEHRKEILRADAYVVRARQLQPVPAAAARRAVPHLSGEGLFGHDRDRRPSRRADGVAHRPRLEDRVHAPRRPAARGRHRGARRATARS